MVITLIKTMEADIFGTAAYLKSIHADLQQRWLAHCERVEDLWRSFTPCQREAIFRAGVKQGKVLKDPNDQSIFRSYALIPEMNVRDVTGSPDYFLDHFEFRATTGLMQQYRIGLDGAKGDHQVIMESMVANKVNPDRDFGNELTFFMNEERYGERYKAKSQEDYQQVVDDLASAVKAGLCVPRGVGELILERQSYLLKHICVLVEDILKLGAIIDESAKEYILPEEAARIVFSTYPDSVDPQPICVLDLVTAAIDRKTTFEAYWDLCRSKPAFLAHAVSLWYSTRPDLVPDEKGRRMPLASDEYVSRAIFEVIHNAVIGIAIWDILYALVKNFLEALDEPEQAIIMQEISNICYFEYDRIRKDFKRFVQIGIGSKHFRRLSNVFDNGTPRVTLKAIPDRVMKEDPQLHHILRLCQPVNGVTQAVRWSNMLDQLHYDQPLEQDKLEEWEFDALGEVSLTVTLVKTLIASLQLPSASPKKGMTYISKLRELMARLDPLKTHTKHRKLPVSLDNISNPNMAKEALSIVDRFSEYYAGGSMVSLYQNLNKAYLEDLEVQLQEAMGTKKTKTKHSSTKSAGASRPATQGQQGKGIETHTSHSSSTSLTRVLASFLATKSEVPATFAIPTESGNSANPEPSAGPEVSNKAGKSTEQDITTYSPSPTEFESLDDPQQSPQPPTLAESETLVEPLASEGPSTSAQPESSTEIGPEMASEEPISAEAEPSPQLGISVEVDASAQPSTSVELEPSANAKIFARPVTPTESEASVETELPADPAKSTEATTAVDELFVGQDPYAPLTTSDILEVIAELDLSEPEPSSQPKISAELDTRTEPGTTGEELAITSEAIAVMELNERAELEVSEKMGEPEPDLNADSEDTQSEPSQPDISRALEPQTEPEISASEDNESEPEQLAEPETIPATDEIFPEVFKVSSSTLAVFSAIFSALDSESNSGAQAGSEHSIKWLDFGAAMIEIGFSILPSVGSLYTFVPGEDSDVATFLTLHRPYRSVIRGDGLLLLALRLKMLYGWGKETFVLE